MKAYFGISLLGIFLLAAESAQGQCRDTTIVISGTGSAAQLFNPGPINPTTPGTLNWVIDNCADSTMTITLENATGNDTIKFANEIIVASRPAGATTHLTGKGRAGGAFVVTENTASDPMLFDFRLNDRGILSNFTIVRKTDNNINHSVVVGSKGTVVRDCHFFRSDAGSLAAGALLSVTADSVLVERCLFRAPPNGKGRSIAISASGGASRNEYRSNIFYSTGLFLNGASFHIYANTFAGSRDDYNAIIVGSGITTGSAVAIEHNLFALKADTLPPIHFAGNVTASDAIVKNAYSRSKPGMALAVYGSTNPQAVTLTAPGTNNNVLLPRGFSKYASGVEFKDYPLAQLRTDSLLSRTHADFGKIPSIYKNDVTNWTNIPDISGLPNSKLWFSGSNVFRPFDNLGSSWSANIKVGALVALDTRQVPSPLDSGAIGRGLTIIRHPTDSTRMQVTGINLNAAYYDTTFAPAEMLFFFSNTLSRLSANDSTSLKNPTTGTPYYSRRAWLAFDNILTVPKEVRTGGTIYVKMLHYNSSGQAPVLSVGAVAQVTGIPVFPINDLSVPALGPTSDTTTGLFHMLVTKQGSEVIDSIVVTAVRAGGGGTQDVKVLAPPAQGSPATFVFQLPRGQFQFQAAPIARVNNDSKTGQATALTRVYNSSQLTSDTAYVTSRTTGCPGLGTKADQFCTIDLALNELKSKQGGTILVQNSTPALPFQDLVIGGTDSFAVTITVPVANGAFDPVHRAVFRGSLATPALTISRKNVNLKGFIFEMPPGATSPAVNVTAGGVTIDGCIFRPVANTGLAGTAISIETPANQEMRFISNLIWGYAVGARINTASSGLRILHNTFFDDVQIFPAGSIGISAHAGQVNAVIANNYFSGSANPLDAGFTDKNPKLDHNAYSSFPPQLRGLSELGALDSIPRLGSVDFSRPSWPGDLSDAMGIITDCSTVKACFGLYAGSSTDTYGPAVTTDVMGKARIGKPEVGAYEAEASTSTVRGLLQISVVSPKQNDPSAHNRLPFTVTSKTLDPADADSLYVWWALGPNVDLTPSILKTHQKQFGISDLTATGTLVDSATGLDPLTTYWVYAALGKTTGGTRVLGYGYRASGTTQPVISIDDCVYGPSAPVCPKDGFFKEPNDKYLTQVTFARPDTGFVKVPEFSFPAPRTIGKVEINSPMPHIKLAIEAGQAKTPGSKQNWTATIRMLEDPGNILDGKDLFIIPTDATSLPQYVPTWQLKREGADVFLIIEGTENGTFTYAFGSAFANPLVESGRFTATQPADQRPSFSFKGRPDSATVTFSVTGSGFSTSNPLVMITPIPAGGTMPNPLLPAKFSNPADPKFNKSLFLTPGLTDLDDSLRRERLYRYYLRAVAADSATTRQVGQHEKPFSLPPVASGDFANATLVGTSQVAVSAAGETGEIAISMPVFSKYKDGENYTDGTQRVSRSLEVIFTVFDGARVSRSSAYIRTEFSDENLHTNEKREFEPRVWNLFSYPWAEADTGTLARVVKATTWNKDEMRILKYKGVGKDAGSFLAYDGTSSAGFSFDSGNAVWSGTTTVLSYVPSSLAGISLDYQPFTLNLAPNLWNDIGLPFNFPIKWRDILNASGLTGQEFTTWRYRLPTSGSKGSWEPLTGLSVVYPWEGLTVRHTAAVALKFPILDSSRSATPLAKQAAGELWSARVQAWNGTALMNLRIGKAASEAVIPEPPNVPGQDFRVCLQRMRPEGAELLSQHLQAGEDWRGHWSLSGTAAKEGIRLAVADNARETPLYLVETLSRKAVPLAEGTEVLLSPEDLKSGDYHLVAGDSRYVEDILNGLVPLHTLALSNHPNPFSGSTLIRYALPETFGKVEFRMKIRDSKGRLVWEKTQRGSNSLRHLWDGRDRGGKQTGAGFYTLEVEAHTPGKATHRAIRRLLKM